MPEREDWDVAVIGAGPAGLTAARAAAAAGARTVVLERAEHPRYKTCGGGRIGVSLGAVRGQVDVPARDRGNAITATLDGRRSFTRRESDPLLAMVVREEFDDTLRAAAESAGVTVRQRPGPEREADALPGPRLEQAGRVPGDQHPVPAQR